MLRYDMSEIEGWEGGDMYILIADSHCCNQHSIVKQILQLKTFFFNVQWDSLGGPVAKTALPMQGTLVQSLAREIDPAIRN